jgi:hypothetical protein
MRGIVLVAALALIASRVEAHGLVPLYDAVTLNIGVSCQWQHNCIADQSRAMKRALKYVQKYQPPPWRIQACNKNASRGSGRMDWVGFDNCVRNAAVRPLPVRPAKKRSRPATVGAGVSRSFGERG